MQSAGLLVYKNEHNPNIPPNKSPYIFSAILYNDCMIRHAEVKYHSPAVVIV